MKKMIALLLVLAMLFAFAGCERARREATEATQNHYNETSPADAYDEAVALMNAGQYEEAIEAFEALNGYEDSAEKIQECNIAILDGKYETAVALMESGSYEEAYGIFVELNGHKDSVEKAEVATYLMELGQQFKNAYIGSYVTFGTYEQDNDLSSGEEEVRWLVLDKQGDKLLLISEFSLDCQQYNNGNVSSEWENSDLRYWLNDQFVNSCFTEYEQQFITLTDTTLESSNAIDGDVKDRVFCISSTEASTYFKSDSERQCKATPYAVAQGVFVYRGNGFSWWWLRTNTLYGRAVFTYGDIDLVYGNAEVAGVRPAMWIEVN